MTGQLKLNESGLEGLVREMHTHATVSDEHGCQADAAMRTAVSSVTSSPVADAVERLAVRFLGQSSGVSVRLLSLGTALTTAAEAISATDGRLAAAANRMEQQ